jgi:hypothetical protein
LDGHFWPDLAVEPATYAPARHLQSDLSDQPKRGSLEGLPAVNFSHTPDDGWTWVETYISGRCGETSIDGPGQDNMANTLRVDAGMGLRLWRDADRQARSTANRFRSASAQ